MFAVLMKASTYCVAASVALTSFVGTPVRAQEGTTIVIEGQRDKSKRKICKSTVPPTGTRMGPRRICRTAADWKIAEERSQRLIETEQQRQRAMNAYNQNEKNALANQGPP